MNPAISSLMIVSGGLLASRLDCYLTRLGGAALIAGAFVMSAVPALAQEHILAVDNGEVRCQASKSDLTRIALKDDQFVAVSRVQTGIEAEDFAIVHEPTRGDIYLSVPEGYTKPNISFFGTTQKGYVYKFDCQVSGDGALQVFVANADIENPQPQAETLQAASLDDRAVGLVRAMFEQRPVTGFEISDAARAPVNVGDIKVQLVSEYRSPTMTGKVLRIENTGAAPMTLQEELIAGDGAIAVSISNRDLASGQATAAYVVVPTGR
ncbi:type-F conjugative transfer system secretin TraK [Qipengyuania profunda]|jgi:conjugal transfer pilus assembly protein TraK|uniref:type-F conjugative transfer system secretin TraK n=1 Tax=Qipengyuania profunda TaxID=3113984 RepID=UPI002A18DB46|nr:type-F conjugative transfer system secretin TraK [Qipengyuania sp. HL-TH1]WPL55491.1 type-F conjugative transfer system secretin TraK [Qipengyuania sp. HL-TH5]|tara:strand:- start:5119 stop:5916 length:798 start_codon:yes stop_codon:yes gene_type:complete